MSGCEWSEIDQAMFDQNLEMFFDIAFDHAKKGKVSFEYIESCIPEDVKERCEKLIEEESK